MPGEPDDREYDQQQRRVAGDLERAHPAWMIVWGDYSRGFWAFPLFGPGGLFLAHRDPRELERLMNAAEQNHHKAGRAP
jgi:hypothetical protein